MLEQIYLAGVIGAGGAGFPTHHKLTRPVQWLIANGAECEPLVASGRYNMRHSADQIVAGLEAVRQAVGRPRCVIATKAKYGSETEALRSAISQAGVPAEIRPLEDFYPVGDEHVLVYEITGLTVPPGGLPLDLGVVVLNVTTLMNIHQATMSQPVTRHLATVTGSVAAPCLVDAPVGATGDDLIRAAGGATVSAWAAIQGGPMMGRVHSAAAIKQVDFGKADSALIVLPASHRLVGFYDQPYEAQLADAKTACIQCARCTDLCPRFLIGQRIRPHRVVRAVNRGGDSADLVDALACGQCGLCELFACPQGVAPRQISRQVKQQLRAAGRSLTDVRVRSAQTTDRQNRRVWQSQLIERLDLADYPTALDKVVRLDPDQVIIRLSQGVGSAARPEVKSGDQVKVGDLIGWVDQSEAGALVHASIDGRVSQVTPAVVKLESG
ncbi:MAG: 4Fe-4S dicluster domain-containing protein [Bifidobacteriaceae bacterium]|nr:4Fe-4S dicluster domain-containing protein [Bifidobacteriaceae bacterium]